MKNIYEFVTSDIKPDMTKNKMIQVVTVSVYAENKKEAIEKAKKISESKYMILKNIDECAIDPDETSKFQKTTLSIQEKALKVVQKYLK